MKEQFKYFAFISYSTHDTDWGKRLQRKLEGYRMPATLCRERGWERKPMKPVFFAPSDIQPGGKVRELQERLRRSRYLIVLCSPHSARSQWVGMEIAFFHSLGRTDNIHFFIIDGVPNSDDPETECFNPVVEALGIPEILGVNIHERIFRWSWQNRERAYVQLITKLLGLEFDRLWKRHQRQLRQRMAAWAVGTLTVLVAVVGVWVGSRPVDVVVALNETTVHNDKLPPMREAVVTMEVGHEVRTCTVRCEDGRAVFAHIPRHFMHRQVRLTVSSRDWQPIDTTVVLAPKMTMPMARNAHAYGDVSFRLWSTGRDEGVPHTPVCVAGLHAVSDAAGYVRMFIPLERQCSVYHVLCALPLESTRLAMPTTESTALVVR